MSLGTRGISGLARAGRCLVVWITGTTVLTAVARAVRPAAAQALNGSWAGQPLDRALVDLAALTLLGSLAWGWLALTVTVTEALRAVAGGRLAWGAVSAVRLGGAGPLRLPDPLRRMVLAGCGVALASGIAQPALASGVGGRTQHGRDLSVLVGLPLPDRAVAPSPSGRRGAETEAGRAVVVRPGDCLWSIAARDLTPHATTRDIGARWREIYAANRAVIGPDPDLLEPGLRLLLPREDPS